MVTATNRRSGLPSLLLILGGLVLAGALILLWKAQRAVAADGSVDPVIGWLADHIVFPLLGTDAGPAQVAAGLRNGLIATAAAGGALALIGWLTGRRRVSVA